MKIKLLIILLIASLGINAFLLNRFFRSTAPKTSYRLINPLTKTIIDSNIQNSNLILHYQDLKPQIETIIQTATADTSVSIFLQDINTGAWLGINERNGFIPASLLKIPIMMAVFKRVDREEIKLTDTVSLVKEDLDPQSGTLYQKGEGYNISYSDLIKSMILTSDNTAKNALKRQLTDPELNAIFAHVGIPNPYSSTNGQTVSPRGFSRIFKSLYLSTFLSPDLSEKALDLTTDTQMENLISAGVSPEIQVAHKYGERPDGLSDCGIIYHPQNPYFLCIMTKEMTVPQAKQLIIELSNRIYQYISR